MATLDLTLDKMRFPGIENFNPEFGTKETMGRGVHSVNLSENDMMPFLLQRPVSVVENSSTSDIEADRKLAIETSGVTLTLGRPSYPGCKVTVYGSFSSGTATVAYDKDANDVSSVVVGAGEHVELEANALRFFEVKAPAMSELVVASGTLSQAKTIPLGYASDAKLAFKVVFPQGHNDATSADSLTLNGIAVVSNQNGALAPIPIHAMTESGSTVYKVLDPNTTLEMYYTADYDGNQTPAFVIVGNPLVLSSPSYSIYANGQIGNEQVATVRSILSNNVPYGWLLCDATVRNKTDYPKLWDEIPSLFKNTANNTFVIDLRDRAIMGADASNPLGTPQESQNKEHYHTVYVKDKGHFHNASNYETLKPGEWGPYYIPGNASYAAIGRVITETNVADIIVNDDNTNTTNNNKTTSDGGTDARPKNVRMNWIIKAM